MRTLRPSYLNAPNNAHHLVKTLFTEMLRQRIGIADMAQRTGLSPATISRWRTHHQPNLLQIEACLNALGLRLYVKKIS